MNYYAHICKNGHVLIERHRLSNEPFCEKCGAEILNRCPCCYTPIKEWSLGDEYTLPPHYDRPSYCRNCVSPYPWTTAALESAAQLIADEGELDAELQEKVIESLPDIIAETPKTNLAAIRMKKALSAAGKFAADGLRQFVIDFGCELVKQQLGL